MVYVMKVVRLVLIWNGKRTDKLKLTFDAHHSDAENTPNHALGSNNGLSMAAFVRMYAATDFSGDLPALAVGGGNTMTPADMRVTGSNFTNAENRSVIDQYQLKAVMN